MRHLGDITKINGEDIELVDVVTGGSPCQDLSVAGKRAGLQGSRSGLFMEQIRLIKEMRLHDKKLRESGELVRSTGDTDFPPWLRPRFQIWENVAGAYSSNSGRDFAAVLEELIRVVEPEAPAIPVPEKGWPQSGLVYGNGWSLAWTTHDSRYFGVPQRRKRISVVADYWGLSAGEVISLIHPGTEFTGDGEVLSLSESMPGDLESCGTPREGTTGGTEAGPFATSS